CQQAHLSAKSWQVLTAQITAGLSPGIGEVAWGAAGAPRNVSTGLADLQLALGQGIDVQEAAALIGFVRGGIDAGMVVVPAVAFDVHQARPLRWRPPVFMPQPQR